MKRSRVHRRTWHAALEAVRAGLSLFADSSTLTPEQFELLEALAAFCGNLRPSDCFPSQPTNQELARKYQVSLRTITNWRRAGCPFERGQAAVLRWLGRRRYAPAGTEARFQRQLTSHRIRACLDEVKVGFAEIRRLKRLYRLDGIAPPDWLRRFRSAPL